MATRRIREFLAGNKIPFGAISHTCAYTAQEIAGLTHIPGRCMAKSVIVRLDGRLAIVVVPAPKTVSLAKLRREVDAGDVQLADESEFCDQFEGCQLGAVPPFGNLFGTETLVDRELAQEDQISFNAGTHTDVFVIRYADYARSVHPRLVDVVAESRKDRRKDRSPAAGNQCCSESPRTQSPQVECGCKIVYHAGAD